jgi:hypothetical protein
MITSSTTMTRPRIPQNSAPAFAGVLYNEAVI